jgi:hypothetical protein
LDILDFLITQRKERELAELVVSLSSALQQRDATIRVMVEMIRENREAIQALADVHTVLNQNQHNLAAKQQTSTGPALPFYRPSPDDDTWN